MKSLTQFFIHNLNIYDYVLFMVILILFLLLLLLAVLLRRKTVISILLFIISITFFLVAPSYGYIKINQRLYSHESKITESRQLVFSPALLVRGYIQNTSQHHFQQCQLILGINKQSKHNFINKLLSFDPFYTTLLTKNNIKSNSTKKFQIIIQPFVYKGKYKLSLRAMCK